MKYCLLGEKLGHSYSREIHMKMGLTYNLEEVAKPDLEKFFKTTKYSGFNVTIPYKEKVIPYLDFIDDAAKAIGAVNTIVNKNGKLYLSKS